MSIAEEILSYKRRNMKKVSLAHRNLTELPDEIGYLADTCEELDLSHNNLTVLPKALGWLNKLKVLNLRNNKLTAASFPSTTPVEVTLPTMIKYVSVQQLDLTFKYYELEKGEGLKGLVALETLLLDNNLMADVPADLAEVVTLKRLSASKNVLTALTGLSTLVNLQRLFLSYNQFTAMPAAITSMIELVELAMNNNLLTSTIALTPLTKLRELNLSNNQIPGVLPAWLGTLPELRVANFNNNLLTSVTDASVETLTKIEQLLVNNNPIQSVATNIPEAARNHNALESVVFRNKRRSPRRLPTT